MGWSDEWDRVLGDLHKSGVGDGKSAEIRLESGHFLAVTPPLQTSTHPDQWALHVKHPGDPLNTWFVSGLGRDHANAAGNALRELRHPEVLREMRNQMSRAVLNDDPYGQGHNGGPGDWADAPSAVFYHHGGS